MFKKTQLKVVELIGNAIAKEMEGRKVQFCLMVGPVTLLTHYVGIYAAFFREIQVVVDSRVEQKIVSCNPFLC